jgi:two-component system alkaline phosphatase synthesis response regulator PhoP
MKNTKPKILLIDTDPFLVRLYSKKFLDEGFIVHSAQTAADGLDKAKSVLPHIILLEISLPGEDGLSLLKKLKRQKETANTPIIILTNINEMPHREQAKIFGAVGYYVKAHLEPAEIVERVLAVIVI